MESTTPSPPSISSPIPLSHQSSSPILLDTVFLLALRGVYFLLARRFLQSTINPTLRDISKPETLLPSVTTAESPSIPTPTPSRSPSTGYFDLELETEDDATPNPSYPPTPNRPTPNLPLASSSNAPYRAPYRNEGSYTPVERVSPKYASVGLPETGIELGNLGQKLKDVHVLQLSHAKPAASAGGTKQIKRATKGLNRMSRWVLCSWTC